MIYALSFVLQGQLQWLWMDLRMRISGLACLPENYVGGPFRANKLSCGIT